MRWLRIIILAMVLGAGLPLALWPPSPAKAATTADVLVTATPESPFPSPIGFTVTFINRSQVDLSWTKPPASDNVTIRAKYGSYPASPVDGYLVYDGDLEVFSDTSMDFEETAGKLYYRAWAQYGEDWSDPAEGNVEGRAMTLLALVLLALGLTVAMFVTRQMMLGFPSALFWAIVGGYAYTESSIPWGDWQYFLFFASLGMTVFTALAAYGLRTKKEELAEGDEFIDEGKDDVKFIDESGGRPGTEELKPEPAYSRAQRIRDRARRRREAIRRKEFS